MSTNLIITRGLKKLAYGRFLSISRYRLRKGLPAAPSAHGPLLDGPDWSYPDGTPGQMNVGQTKRYVRDQEFGEIMSDFGKQVKAIEEMREKRRRSHRHESTNST